MARLPQRWSPEQIAGRRFMETGHRISAETIYRYIARDTRAGGTLSQQLRYQGKPCRKRYGRTDYRGRIPSRVDIDQRPAVVHTITYDNGREFNGHQEINDALACDSCFAEPCHSRARGLNENVNGLLRRYFPKNMAFDALDKQDVCDAINQMHHRARKSLGFKTPWEVFAEMVQHNPNTKKLVALVT